MEIIATLNDRVLYRGPDTNIPMDLEYKANLIIGFDGVGLLVVKSRFQAHD